MLTNLIRAKISAHTMALAVAAMFFMAHHFFADPHAAAWLHAHWVIEDAGETIGATIMWFGIYQQPVKSAA